MKRTGNLRFFLNNAQRGARIGRTLQTDLKNRQTRLQQKNQIVLSSVPAPTKTKKRGAVPADAMPVLKAMNEYHKNKRTARNLGLLKRRVGKTTNELDTEIIRQRAFRNRWPVRLIRLATLEIQKPGSVKRIRKRKREQDLRDRAGLS